MELGLDRLQGPFMRLAKLGRAQRTGLLAGIVLLLGGGYAYLFLLPAQDQLDKLSAQQLELQRRLNEVRSVAANLGAFEARLGELEKELRSALLQLPDSKELPGLLTDISSRGKNAGLEFKAFRPREEVPRDFYAEVPIEIELTGRYHDLARFFDDISKLPRIVNVSDLQISIEDETQLGTRLLVRGNATTFRFLEQSGVPAGGEDAAGKKAKGGA